MAKGRRGGGFPGGGNMGNMMKQVQKDAKRYGKNAR